MTPSNWVVNGPRKCLIGPFPSESAALAWGGEWQTVGPTSVIRFEDLPLDELDLPEGFVLTPDKLVSPARVAQYALQAQHRRDNPWAE